MGHSGKGERAVPPKEGNFRYFPKFLPYAIINAHFSSLKITAMIEYRRADITDLDALVEQRFLFLRDVHPDMNMESLRESVRDYYAETIPTGECVYWLVSESNRVIGGGGWALRRHAPGYQLRTGISAYVFNMYTEPAYRKQGFDREIMVRLLDDARQRGIVRVDLHATELGRTVYEKLGFKPPDHVYLEYPIT